MPFPLYQRPNSIVFLDDDADYLETLALVMPKDWGVQLFTHVNDCTRHCIEQHTLWEADVWQHQDLVNRWRAGGSLIPQILAYWKSNTQRYLLTQTCVVDFAMPAMTGLDFLKSLPSWPAHRVLLTGKADELIAVGAFNDRLIDRYVPKQHANIGKHLTDILIDLHRKPMDSHQSVWRSALKKEQFAVLQDSSARNELRKLIQDRQWIEYVVIPAPFGILALDRNARAHWLQLELRSDLAAVADLAQSTGQTDDVVEKIRLGTHLINTELNLAMNSDEESHVKTSFEIGSTKNLLGALFRIAPDLAFGASYNDTLAAMPPRFIG
jgi:CheY-like chemotaxis protein